MSDVFLRLLWALPLVLMTGIAIMLLLRRVLPLPASSATDIAPLAVRHSLTLADDTRVHLLEVDRKSYLLVESSRQALLQPVETTRTVPPPAAPAWLQRMYKSEAR